MTFYDALKAACNGDPYERHLVWSMSSRGPDYIAVSIIDPVAHHRTDVYVTTEMLNDSERFVNNLYEWLEQSPAVQTSSSWHGWEYGTISKLLAYCRQRLKELKDT